MLQGRRHVVMVMVLVTSWACAAAAEDKASPAHPRSQRSPRANLNVEDAEIRDQYGGFSPAGFAGFPPKTSPGEFSDKEVLTDSALGETLNPEDGKILSQTADGQPGALIAKRFTEFVGKRRSESEQMAEVGANRLTPGSEGALSQHLLVDITGHENAQDEKELKDLLHRMYAVLRADGLKRQYEFVGKRNYDFVGRKRYDFLGKRRPYEFIGKRYDFLGKRSPYDFLGKKSYDFVGKRVYDFLGKRGPYEFVGKRGPYEFVGKREPYEFVGKRGPYEFVGKREPYEFVGKRGPYEFVGKGDSVEDEIEGENKLSPVLIPPASPTEDSDVTVSSHVLSTDKLTLPDKRYSEFLGKRKRTAEFGEAAMTDTQRLAELLRNNGLRKRLSQMLGQRLLEHYPEFIGK